MQYPQIQFFSLFAISKSLLLCILYFPTSPYYTAIVSKYRSDHPYQEMHAMYHLRQKLFLAAAGLIQLYQLTKKSNYAKFTNTQNYELKLLRFGTLKNNLKELASKFYSQDLLGLGRLWQLRLLPPN